MTRIFLVLSILALSGCIHHRSGIAGKKPEWTVGNTTRREVVAKWGNPDHIRKSEWVWKDSSLIGGKFKAGYMGIGFTVGNTISGKREWRLDFDERGILRRQTLVNPLPETTMWSVNPLSEP